MGRKRSNSRKNKILLGGTNDVSGASIPTAVANTSAAAQPAPGGPPGMPGSTPPPPPIGGAPPSDFLGMIRYRLSFLNESKYFAGLCMIMLNVGSKYVTIKFSKSAEEYFKANVTKQILVFSMAWMVTRDIITALIITAVFVILSDHLFNEESSFCIVPEKYRVLSTLIDTNGDGIISEEELEKAEETLRKARQQKIVQDQRKAFMQFDYQKEQQ